MGVFTFKGEKGLTILELLAAIGIFVVLVGVSTPFISSAMQTYRLNGAARSIVGDIRYARSLAVSNGSIHGFHWGGDPNDPATPGPTFYRVERNPDGACPSWPAAADGPSDANVITGWYDLAADYQGITIVSITGGVPLGGVAFDSRGVSVNPCTGVVYPVTITVRDASGAERTIEVRSAGRVEAL